MQNLYLELNTLDQRCYETYVLNEEILMEHAGEGMNQYIRNNFSLGSKISIVCGPGNNGADGLVLARLLHGDYTLQVLLPYGAKSQMAQQQLKRYEHLGGILYHEVTECDLLVDALYGSGLSRELDEKSTLLLQQMNHVRAFKIACDIPSGITLDGRLKSEVFTADATLSMGALKLGFYSDSVKVHLGDVTVIDLGLSRNMYEKESHWKLLDESDMTLPLRHNANTHKGNYGHLSVICGEKEGAAIIAASAALRFGTGLVTLISNENIAIPYELMLSHLLPETTTAIALGMGLGQEFSQNELEILLRDTYPLVLDADIFSHPLLPALLKRKAIVITPHPKEFVLLLKVLNLANIDVATLQENRFTYCELFSKSYPETVLVLKGANVIIANQNRYFINPHGSNILAKGGSGDVLAGLIGALLAQGQTPLEAACNGSLAHTSAAKHVNKNNYALTPLDLIESICHL